LFTLETRFKTIIIVMVTTCSSSIDVMIVPQLTLKIAHLVQKNR
jgi:hypothetical protein